MVYKICNSSKEENKLGIAKIFVGIIKKKNRIVIRNNCWLLEYFEKEISKI